ncbi:radical SAM/SPASM domain-containing protein [Desulfofundulus salinus]|uniref:Radical SAM protein n=1 Tax=Desulfofundulus salinus TaxID=2419843 RepID=A0A494X066_9FIRM|nr:radical SAM protein [Desulfofundulus salinum]RKO66587.1 radical SAM protein [Desulfofundulus salinum]
MTKEIKLLVLLVTGDCNLRCVYCYARGGESKRHMSWEVARHAVDYAAARSKSFKIQFSGGEPLLNLPLVKEVAAYVRSRRLSVKLQLQTNGTLITPAVAQELKSLGVALGVSLDGRPEINDRLRSFAGGGGSTLAVIRGLQNLAAEGIKVGLTVVLTAESTAGLTQLVELAAYLGNVYGISLDLLRPLGRGREGRVAPPEPELLNQQVKAAIKRAEEIARLGGPLIRFREVERLKYQLHRGITRRHYCYATTGQSMAVMPDGSVYPCASLSGLTEFYLGRITDGRFSLAEALAGTSLLGRTVEVMAGCRDCWHRYLCGGGCPARAYALTGRVDRACKADCLLRKVYLDFVKKENTYAHI